MRKRYNYNFKRITLFSLILISIGLIGFSLFKIKTGSKEITNAISEWENSPYSMTHSKYLEDINTNVEDTQITPKEFIPVTYKERPSPSKVFGKIILLKTKEILPLIEGTENADLDKGAGHFTSTVLPGEVGNSSIFGHRDGIFRTLKDVVVGDKFIVETSAGVLYFSVTQTHIVLPTDSIILKKYTDETVTLVTCYPFYFVGNAPKRYVVIAKLIKSSRG